MHVAAITALALVQPVLEQLSDNSEFFIVRRSEAIDVVLVVVFLSLAIPSLILSGVAIAKRISKSAARISEFCFMALLLSL
ncbi:MAG TPA: hypothetical protein VI958_11465, partial [Acidobacteriota bacterium]